jgi:predicted nucleotidyltransferase component of viral defense system
MIRQGCFTKAWIQQVSTNLHYPDANLIEKVIRAFSLVEMLSDSGCPYIWKGGTALMILLGGSRHRLSIDVDIVTDSGLKR